MITALKVGIVRCGQWADKRMAGASHVRASLRAKKLYSTETPGARAVRAGLEDFA
jgi:hypothetical protein